MTRKLACVAMNGFPLSVELAKVLAANGYDLIFHGKNLDEMGAAKIAIESSSGASVSVWNARADAGYAELMADRLGERTMDVLVYVPSYRATEVFADEHEDVVEALHLTRIAVAEMMPRSSGHILFVCPKFNLEAKNARFAGAVRGALLGFAESIRKDFFGTPLRVTVLEPAFKSKSISEVAGNALADVSNAAVWALSRPAHVNIQNIRLS